MSRLRRAWLEARWLVCFPLYLLGLVTRPCCTAWRGLHLHVCYRPHGHRGRHWCECGTIGRRPRITPISPNHPAGRGLVDELAARNNPLGWERVEWHAADHPCSGPFSGHVHQHAWTALGAEWSRPLERVPVGERPV